MIERLVKSELADVELIHVRMAFSSEMSEIGRVRLGKFFHLFALVVRIIYHRFADGVRILYYPPAGPDRIPMYRDLVILLSTRWLFNKTILHFHAGGVSELYDRLPRWQQWFFRQAYFGADAAIRLSDLVPDDAQRLEAQREYIIPNGIDDPRPDLAMQQSGSASNTDGLLRLLFVGVVRESKGVLVLVEACGELAARGVPFQLDVMGHWESEEFAARVKDRVSALGIQAHVRFLGVLTGEEKQSVFRQAQVFCFPTFFNSEAFPVVLLEATAWGMPVVATRWRGIPSIVRDGETGFLVEPHDFKAVADRLVYLAEDEDLRLRLGLAGREKFLREFTISRHLERMRGMLIEVAGLECEEARELPLALATA